MKKVLFLIFLASSVIVNGQKNWYVDQEQGSDSNNGKSPGAAFQSFDMAADSVNPGDTIFIIGEYHNVSYDPGYVYGAPDDAHLWNGENSLNISRLHGNASNYITITSYKGYADRPTIIKGDGANIIRVKNCSYLRIKELKIQGEVENIPLSTAKALQFVYIIDDENLQGEVTDPAPADIKHRDEEGSDPDGIFKDETYPDISDDKVVRPSYTDTRGMYLSTAIDHVEILDNTISYTPGGGLRVSDGTYVKVAGNEIYGCSRRSYSGTHAFVVTKTLPVDAGDTAILISNNLVHHNYNEIYSWSPAKTIITPRIDEGKGISLQRNNKEEWINGNGRIVVVNNICYWNGYSGVHSNDGYRIDFINNTCFMNSYTNSVRYAGTDSVGGNNIGISAQGGGDIKMINNISVVDTDWGGYALSAGSDVGDLVVRNNLIFGVNGTVKRDNDISGVEVSTLEAGPQFVNAPADYHDVAYSYDLSLNVGSPAIGYADPGYSPVYDYANNERDSSPDAGALEYFTSSGIEDLYSDIKVYPTVFTGAVKIERQSAFPLKLTMYNIAGTKVLEKEMGPEENSAKINAGILKPGVYLLKAGSRTFKLIKK